MIEVLGTYDPAIPDTDARCVLDSDRMEYWLGVGALPSDAVRVLYKKYGRNGTRVKEMEQARARLSLPKIVPAAGEPVFVPEPKAEPAPAAPAEAPVASAEAAVAESAEASAAAGEAPAEQA